MIGGQAAFGLEGEFLHAADIEVDAFGHALVQLGGAMELLAIPLHDEDCAGIVASTAADANGGLEALPATGGGEDVAGGAVGGEAFHLQVAGDAKKETLAI